MNQKVGRNDPCPCGSGKKYKNCHMILDQEAKKTYTPTGKRKFKAKLLSGTSAASQTVFQGVAPSIPTELPSFDALKVRFAKSDFRVKSGETQEAPLPFAIPSPEATQPIPSPEGPFEPPPLPQGEFKPTEEDFRKKEEGNEE